MSRRTQAVRRVAGWLVRGGLVGLWALVGWGTLLLVASVPGAWSDGLGVAVARLLPAPGGGLWAWLNGLAVMLAATGWILLAAYVVWARWPDAEDGPD